MLNSKERKYITDSIGDIGFKLYIRDLIKVLHAKMKLEESKNTIQSSSPTKTVKMRGKDLIKISKHIKSSRNRIGI